MTIRLLHVHQLDTLYLCYGVKCQSGVIWGHWGQKIIFTNKVVLEPRVSPENTSKSVDKVTFLQKLEPKVIDP